MSAGIVCSKCVVNTQQFYWEKNNVFMRNQKIKTSDE